ncbi:cysteine three histidine 1 [Genypterus blacodes]|uniref:cysteine three histidine 1 n=1 Tax=Genypterus blacodes TaxID=154954 RepID=UPI003F760D67
MSSDDHFLPPYQDEELVGNLLSSDVSDGDIKGVGGISLAKALHPLVGSSSPPLIPWICSTRYKTELCTTYAATGFCKYAERCQFAHGLQELHVPFRHPKYKTQLCRSYHTTSYCYYGSRCLFVHSPDEQRPALRHRKNIPCRNFRAFGICPFGTRCTFLHVEGGSVGSDQEVTDDVEEKSSPEPQVQPQPKAWKPRGALCRTFGAFGFCLYGTRCRFQHGLPNKLKTPGADQAWPASLFPQLSRGNTDLLSPSTPFSMSPDSPNWSSPPSTSASPLATPPSETTAHNAFTFSNQHLNLLLLPLALHLQQLESRQVAATQDNRAL